MINKHFFSIALTLIMAVGIFSIANIVAGATASETVNFVGDIGCKSGSTKNLDAMGKQNVPLVGLGDYLYTCKTSKVQKQYDAIEDKKGVWGNHETEKNQGKSWAASNFKSSNDLMQWKPTAHVQIFGLNVVGDKVSSSQITALKPAITAAKNDKTIWWIGIVEHANVFAPSVSGGHSASKGLSVLVPILKDCEKCFSASGHNHITAIGNIQNIPVAIFGAGGDLGDKVKSLKDFKYAIDTASFGNLVFTNSSIVANVYAGNGLVKSFDFAKKAVVEPEPEPSKFGNVTIGAGNVWIPTLNGTEIINATAGILNYTK